MFEIAQKHVRFVQFPDCHRRQQLLLSKQGQRFQRRPQAQMRFAPAANDLKHLHQELDLADSARTDLDVVGDLAPLHFLADLRMQLAQAGQRAEVEVAPVHERGDDGLELRGPVAADGPALHPGVAFPFATLRGEVVLQHVETHHQGPAVAIGPEARVDPEHEAVRGHFAESRRSVCAPDG